MGGYVLQAETIHQLVAFQHYLAVLTELETYQLPFGMSCIRNKISNIQQSSGLVPYPTRPTGERPDLIECLSLWWGNCKSQLSKDDAAALLEDQRLSWLSFHFLLIQINILSCVLCPVSCVLYVAVLGYQAFSLNKENIFVCHFPH